MNDNIIWVVEGTIRNGQREEFEIIMNDMVQSTQREDGTLNYEWTLGEDDAALHVYERYKDADAARAHLSTWGQNAARFMSVVEITRIVVYSSLPADLKEALSGAVFMKPIGGFSK